MPRPRTSSNPARISGGSASRCSPSRRRRTWSSATRTAPRSIRRKARSDLPLPDGPRSSTPMSFISTQVAWSLMKASPGAAGSRLGRQAVSDARLGQDDLGIGRIGLQFLAQLIDIDAQINRVLGMGRPPYRGQDLLVGHHMIGAGGQEAQQIIFALRQADLLGVAADDRSEERRVGK